MPVSARDSPIGYVRTNSAGNTNNILSHSPTANLACVMVFSKHAAPVVFCSFLETRSQSEYCVNNAATFGPPSYGHRSRIIRVAYFNLLLNNNLYSAYSQPQYHYCEKTVRCKTGGTAGCRLQCGSRNSIHVHSQYPFELESALHGEFHLTYFLPGICHERHCNRRYDQSPVSTVRWFTPKKEKRVLCLGSASCYIIE